MIYVIGDIEILVIPEEVDFLGKRFVGSAFKGLQTGWAFCAGAFLAESGACSF
jgi:hypothetical protein